MGRIRITQAEAERRLAALRPEMLRRAQASLPRQDAEDAVQEAGYYCWEVAESLYDDAEGEAGFRAWAMSVLLRRVRTIHSRRQGRGCAPLPNWDGGEGEDCDGTLSYRIEDEVLDRIEREEARAALYEVIGRANLSERQEAVVRLILADEDTREVAARLGISVKNVNAHLSAAREKMIGAR